MTARPRILVLRGGAIGDFVLTLPAIQALRDPWPDAHIEVIGYPHIARLALMDGTANAVDSLDRAGIARLFSLRGGLDETLAERVCSFDLVLTYLHDPEGSVRENLEATGVAQVLHVSPIDPPEHAADHLARPLESLAIYAEGRLPTLQPDAAARAAAARTLRDRGCDPEKTVCLHPGSGSAKKNWPMERYFELARRLRRHGFCPVFTFGDADTTEADAFRSAPTGLGIPLETPELRDLAAVLSQTKAFVGNDSGITHLAAAVGVPTIALFGPTDPAVWGPRGTRVTTLRADSHRLDNLPAGAVEQALLQCSMINRE